MTANRPARALAAALLASTAALAGCAAQAKPAGQPAPTAPATHTTADGHPASGTVHIIDYSINTDGLSQVILMTGTGTVSFG